MMFTIPIISITLTTPSPFTSVGLQESTRVLITYEVD